MKGGPGTSGTSGTSGTQWGLALILLLLLAAGPAAQQQQPPRDNRATPATNSAPAGTGVISGSVTGDDGRAVRFGYVVLLGTTTGVVKVSSTDADGRFTFSNLPVDRFTIGASKAPYLAMIAGAKRPGRPGTALALANGQRLSNVSIRMSMGAAIAGAVTDERGQPASNVLVNLMQVRMQGGERTLVAGPNIGVDDQGRYRFFGLTAGDYVVVALRLGAPPARPLTTAEVDAAINGSVPAPSTSPAPLRYAPVYFPGTTRGAEAVPISVGLGEERANVDFRIAAVPTVRIEGTLSSRDGQPVGGVTMILASVPGSVLSTGNSVRITPDGRFTVPNVAPGSYTLTVAGSGPLAGQFARGTVEVAGNDVLGVQLMMQPSMSFSGRLVFDSASPPSPAGRRVLVRALGTGPVAAAPSLSNTAADGTFSATNVTPGRFILGGPLSFGPTPDSMTWSLASVIVDGRDVTDLPITIADSPPKDVVVTYTDKWQELSGRLQSQSGAPVSDYTIIVFPEDKAYWIQGTRRIVTARPGTDGRFVLSGKGPTTLPPGKYLIAAVTDIGRDEQFDPAFLSQIVPAAIPITLAVGDRKIQDLAIK